MADRAIITPADVPDAYAGSAVVAAWTGSNVSNKNRFLWTGREILELHNAGSTTRSCTLTSAPDSEGRTQDVVISLLSGEYRVFPFIGPASAEGWLQADGYIWFEGAHAEAEWRVLRLPARI